MIKKYYHATSEECAKSIVRDGKIKCNYGEIFLAETIDDALKFLFFRQLDKVVIFEVELDENKVVESFDHNAAFFGCRAWMTFEDIPVTSETSAYIQDMSEIYQQVNRKVTPDENNVAVVAGDVLQDAVSNR